MFENVELNSNHVNKAIKANILSDDQMREIGFTDNKATTWYFCRGLGADITFNVCIPKNGDDIRIDVLDEDFLQPYDFQSILTSNPDHEFALKVQEMSYDCMEHLIDAGVLSGWKRGDYI